ncbi:Flagellar biosynthesis/type III secretory pathway protein FliH [Sulfobacillus thermosulfidooxidans DSM 9293]|uniref:Flagellar biosynthesis/type III secretory pathway protein FliH n=1 Tax=Sulfobacillus thermosulfidooxidans (strain DSM 9293 / VKM B-1269 / AT-1) TaxID=929705 RepID=A0A1W1WEE5_SULTA|nr:hypothetical protein [Sulfobacillus thermosulfidooxidans]SMC04572.1 Flagellar biosynthesis/type III secretory pathway protein FliH [Sulfobacillus thermosulfidooxidans DSM 9293]
MTLSSNVLKAWAVKNGMKPIRLDPQDDGKGQVQVALTDAKEAAMNIVTRAKEEARAIIEEAEGEANQIRQQAQAQGYEQGHQQGVLEAKQQVMNQWSEMAQQVQHVLNKIEQLGAFTKLLEPELVLAQAAALAGKFIENEAMHHPDSLRTYLTDIIGSLEAHQVTLFLSPEFHNTLEHLTKNWGDLWSQVKVAVDRSLENLAMRIETADGEEFLVGPIQALSKMLDEVLYGSV